MEDGWSGWQADRDWGLLKLRLEIRYAIGGKSEKQERQGRRRYSGGF